MIVAVLCLLAAGATSCSSAKKITKATKSQEVSLPMDKAKYKSDKNFYRAVQSGVSPDIATAKKIALLNAKAEMANNITALMKGVAENYTNQRSLNDVQEFEARFDENIRTVTNLELNDVKIVGDELYKGKKGGPFTYWICIEVNKADLAEKAANRISKDAKMQIDFDKAEFMKVFNEEMSKFE